MDLNPGMFMPASFPDHFSGHAEAYARFRPEYPRELYTGLAALCPPAFRAWDCATGNGQAARGLAPHALWVLATDASRRQIAHAVAPPRVRFAVAAAERAPLAERSVELITVAQALHWFDLDVFYAEARRVLVPGGLLAVWSYNFLRVSPEVDAVVSALYTEVGPYWPPERAKVETGYRDLPFPFDEEPVDVPAMAAEWSLDQLRGYLETWSAVRRCREAAATDPVARLLPDLTAAWGHAPRRRVAWPLTLKLGRNR